MTGRSITVVVGTRPNFIKLAPLARAIERHPALRLSVVHTGQHRDHQLSGAFFEQLELPRPDVQLRCEAVSAPLQTASISTQLAAELPRLRPDWVVVIGDVNSTLAAALTARQLGIPVAHVEAGLRNGSGRMIEELNRRLVDAIASLHFATEASALDHLAREGVPRASTFLVGNVLVDALDRVRARLGPGRTPHPHRGRALLTLHRPENVDQPERFARLLSIARRVAEVHPLLFALHPRTARALAELGAAPGPLHGADIVLSEPLGYLEMVELLSSAPLVVTDSGGLQEETTALSVPCLTLRPDTERPITVTHGTNRVVDDDLQAAQAALMAPPGAARRPPLWDGQAASRIADELAGAPLPAWRRRW